MLLVQHDIQWDCFAAHRYGCGTRTDTHTEAIISFFVAEARHRYSLQLCDQSYMVGATFTDRCCKSRRHPNVEAYTDMIPWLSRPIIVHQN